MNILAVMCLLLPTTALQATPQASFYVAVDGNDQWSGCLRAPNSAHSDGPFRTLDRARLALRRLKQDPQAELTVMVRGGTHFLSQTLVLSPEDSGTKDRPVRYLAFGGEKPVLSGGRPIAPWQPAGKGLYRASLPDVKTGQWYFRQLRVGDRLQHQAREPNFDPRDPIRGGWLLADEPLERSGAFGAAVGTGAIETYTTTTPNVIHNNLVVDSVGLKVTEDKVWRTPFYAWGIYLDGYVAPK